MSGPSYFALSAELPESSSELVQWVLHDNESLGLEIQEPSLKTMPGEQPIAAGSVRVRAFFAERKQAEKASAEIRRHLPGVSPSLREALSEDWSESWKSQVRSSQVGRLWVGPPWRVADAVAGSVRIVIEPKMAFGTGDHPSTQLCLEALQAAISAQAAQSVLDVGTGSGVLAIAARKLGARRVLGIDSDSNAILLAKENCALNQVDGIELSDAPLEAMREAFDLVVANLYANALIELAPHFPRLARRQAMLCGILEEQAAEVEAAYRRQGLVYAGAKKRGEWVRLDFTVK